MRRKTGPATQENVCPSENRTIFRVLHQQKCNKAPSYAKKLKGKGKKGVQWNAVVHLLFWLHIYTYLLENCPPIHICSRGVLVELQRCSVSADVCTQQMSADFISMVLLPLSSMV